MSHRLATDGAARPPRAEPLAERRLGPLALRLLPASAPTADIEVLVALVGAIGLAALVLMPLEPFSVLAGTCAFKHASGVPCMTCGTTRAVLAASHGELLAALRLNPLVALGGAAFALYTPVAWVLWLARLPRPRLGLRSRGARVAAACGLALAILANWAFLIADGR